MARTPTPHLEAWLAAESRDDERAAEAALGSLFAELPLRSPSAGFAARVVRLAGVVPARDVFEERWARWAVVALLTAAAVSLLVVPVLLSPLASWFSLAGVLDGGAQLLILAARWIGAGAGFWRTASEVGAAISLAASKPPVALALVAMVAASFGAFRMLNRLMSPERSTSHA